MVQPVKKLSAQEKQAVLERALPDYYAGNAQQKKLIEEMLYSQVGFKSPQEFKTFLTQQQQRFREPTIGSAEGKKFVPIPKGLVEAATKPDIGAFAAPEPRKQIAQRRLTQLQREAAGEKRPRSEAFGEFFSMLESALPARGAPQVRRGRDTTLKTFKGRRRALKKQRKKEAKAIAAALPKELAISDAGMRYSTLPTIIKPLLNTEAQRDLLKVIETGSGKVAPITVIKQYYPNLRNQSDYEAAQVLANRLNAFRKKKEKVNPADLYMPKNMYFYPLGSEKKKPRGYYDSTNDLIVINSDQATAGDILTVMVHELTHAYDRERNLRGVRRIKDVSNKVQKGIKQMFDEGKTNPENLRIQRKFLKDPNVNAFIAGLNTKELVKQVQASEMGSKPSPLRRKGVYKGYGKKEGKTATTISYLTQAAEVGPNLYGFIRRYAASQMGIEIRTRKGLQAFIDRVNKNPAIKENLFMLMDSQRTRGVTAPEVNQRILDRLQFDKKVQLEFLKWAKGQQREDKAYV